MFVCNSTKYRLSLLKYMLNSNAKNSQKNSHDDEVKNFRSIQSPRLSYFSGKSRSDMISPENPQLKKFNRKITKTLKKELLKSFTTQKKESKFVKQVINETSSDDFELENQLNNHIAQENFKTAD